MNKDLTGKQVLLAKKRDYRKYLRDYELADTIQKKLAAKWGEYNIAPSPEIMQQIKQLQAERCVQDAVKALELKKPDEARRQAQQALKEVPGYPPAVAIIEKLDAGEKRQALIAEGKAHMSQGKYDLALEKLSKAADMGSDEDLAANILECRFQLALAAADKLRDEKKYDEAIAAYEIARALKPSEGPHIDALQAAVKKLKAYQENFAKGEEAMKAKQYAAARGFYMAARGQLTPPPDEVVQRIALSLYLEYVEQGRAALARKDYDAALAYLKNAKAQQKTAGVEPAEIDGLLREAEAGVRGASP